jgi:hypothetical protein
MSEDPSRNKQAIHAWGQQRVSASERHLSFQTLLNTLPIKEKKEKKDTLPIQHCCAQTKTANLHLGAGCIRTGKLFSSLSFLLAFSLNYMFSAV